MPDLLLINAEALSISLESGSIHCSVSSPPYWSLRRYSGEQIRPWPVVDYAPMPGLSLLHIPAMDCALGLEPDPESFIGHLVLCYREVKRVLRDDGVCWIVISDSYAGGGRGGGGKQNTNIGSLDLGKVPNCNIEPGNLIGVPARLMLALEADGWIVRNNIIWQKPGPRPESVAGWRYERHRVKIARGDRASNQYRQGADGNVQQGPGVSARAQREAYFDEGAGAPQYADCPGCLACSPNSGYVLRQRSWRHTRAHETVLMCVKRMGYYADQEAVREAARDWGTRDRTKTAICQDDTNYMPRHDGGKHCGLIDGNNAATGRNPRSVLMVSPEPTSEAHYATFPTRLAERLGQATCPRQCCPACGAGWAPIVKKDQFDRRHDDIYAKGRRGMPNTHSTILAYRPTCACPAADPIPGVVLDPFVGSGSSLIAARRLGLRGVGCDLSGPYLRDIARKRLELDDLEAWENGDGRTIEFDGLPLFAQGETA